MSVPDNQPPDNHLVIIEMFCGGSHKQLIQHLLSLAPDTTLLTLSDKKWHWRARCGALQLLPQLQTISRPVTTLFMTSVGSLPEVVGLCPQLRDARKVLYFHENQLVYPTQGERERDYQFGYNQIMSALMADLILFNSSYNLTSFLGTVDSFLNKMPDYKPKGVAELIRRKSEVLYFPVEFQLEGSQVRDPKVLHIVWPHRWEHDKNPVDFFNSLTSLISSGLHFKVSVLGKTYQDVPEIFREFQSSHPDYITQWGPLDSREDYLTHLRTCDVIVSTAVHEFYGVAMLEGLWAGCFPLAPNRLSYPEIYPAECLYNTPAQLTKQLRQLCKNPGLARRKWEKVVGQVDMTRYSWDGLKARYSEVLSIG